MASSFRLNRRQLLGSASAGLFALGGKTAHAAMAPGDVLGIVGESGSGNTTLLRALAQDLPDVAIVQDGRH